MSHTTALQPNLLIQNHYKFMHSYVFRWDSRSPSPRYDDIRYRNKRGSPPHRPGEDLFIHVHNLFVNFILLQATMNMSTIRGMTTMEVINHRDPD